MGNALYRPSPRRVYLSESGHHPLYEYGANQITGWRHSQEDRYVCIPQFHGEYHLFGVYDGHGGEEVVQYIKRFLHLHIKRELEQLADVEVSMYLGFLTCDTSMRYIMDKEYKLIEDDLEKEFEIPEKEDRRKVLFAFRTLTEAAGTSQENPNIDSDDLKSSIMTEVQRQLPSIAYLTQAPVEPAEKSDDDEDYQPGDKDCNFLKYAEDDSEGESDTSETSSSSDSKNDLDNDQGRWLETNNDKENNDDTETNIVEKSTDGKKQFGFHCGSTATVLMFNQHKIWIAYVGDSRAVACIAGQPIELTKDHKPSNRKEYNRILSAGGSVSEGRVGGEIDMSRAFGDFKFKKDENPPHIMSNEPDIVSLDYTPELDFIILASDGIWNTMESKDIILYIQERMKENTELIDICAELFEEMLPSQVTEDGSGCDNMTAIIIKFKHQECVESFNYICQKEQYKYNYPPTNFTFPLERNSEDATKRQNTKSDEVHNSVNSSLDVNCMNAEIPPAMMDIVQSVEEAHNSANSSPNANFINAEVPTTMHIIQNDVEAHNNTDSTQQNVNSMNVEEEAIMQVLNSEDKTDIITNNYATQQDSNNCDEDSEIEIVNEECHNFPKHHPNSAQQDSTENFLDTLEPIPSSSAQPQNYVCNNIPTTNGQHPGLTSSGEDIFKDMLETTLRFPPYIQQLYHSISRVHESVESLRRYLTVINEAVSQLNSKFSFVSTRMDAELRRFHNFLYLNNAESEVKPSVIYDISDEVQEITPESPPPEEREDDKNDQDDQNTKEETKPGENNIN